MAEYGHSLALDIPLSERRHRGLKAILNRRGIAQVNSKTPEGKIIADLMCEFQASANQKLPEATRALLSEMLVGWILIQRSAMTHLLVSRKPSPQPTERGKSQRQAMQISVASMSKATDAVLKILKSMGICEQEQTKTKIEQALEELRQLGAEQAAKTIVIEKA